MKFRYYTRIRNGVTKDEEVIELASYLHKDEDPVRLEGSGLIKKVSFSFEPIGSNAYSRFFGRHFSVYVPITHEVTVDDLVPLFLAQKYGNRIQFRNEQRHPRPRFGISSHLGSHVIFIENGIPGIPITSEPENMYIVAFCDELEYEPTEHGPQITAMTLFGSNLPILTHSAFLFRNRVEVSVRIKPSNPKSYDESRFGKSLGAYYIPLEQPITDEQIIEDAYLNPKMSKLTEQINLSYADFEISGDDPFRLIPKRLGNFRYFEAADGSFKITFEKHPVLTCQVGIVDHLSDVPGKTVLTLIDFMERLNRHQKALTGKSDSEFLSLMFNLLAEVEKPAVTVT